MSLAPPIFDGIPSIKMVNGGWFMDVYGIAIPTLQMFSGFLDHSIKPNLVDMVAWDWMVYQAILVSSGDPSGIFISISKSGLSDLDDKYIYIKIWYVWYTHMICIYISK